MLTLLRSLKIPDASLPSCSVNFFLKIVVDFTKQIVYNGGVKRKGLPMKKSVLKKLLSIKKRFHVMALEHKRLDAETIEITINGIAIQTKNPEAPAFLKYWKDSPSAFADLMGEVKALHDAAE